MSLNVIVVDDDLITLHMVAEAVSNCGCNVRQASNGNDAKMLIEEKRPDIVFTDWNMPGCSGIELSRWIKQNYTMPYIYVIMSTDRSTVSDAVEAFDAGVDEFLRKPVENAEIQARIMAATRILSMESRHLTILALAKLAESRDPETGQHLERVGAYVRILHEHLKKNGPYTEQIAKIDQETLVLTSCLHDIGKVGIPDSILLKPGRLNDYEYQMMKMHTTIGADSLRVMETSAGTDFLQMAHDIALCHHERFDGHGYPNGLKGQDIPLVARLVTLADVFDALSCNRVYRDAMLHGAVHDIIVREANKQFDPVITDAYIACESQFTDAKDRLS